MCMRVMFQVKFQVCTPQKNWSLSSPHSKIMLPRMDSPDRSTTTFPTVSAEYISTVFLHAIHYFGLFSSMWYMGCSGPLSRCKSLLHVSFLLTDCSVLFCDCIWLCSSTSLLCSDVCTAGIVQCHWGWGCCSRIKSIALLLSKQTH